MTLRTLNYGNYGIFLIMGNAGFCPSTVVYPDGSSPCPRRRVGFGGEASDVYAEGTSGARGAI